jgi:starch synthase
VSANGLRQALRKTLRFYSEPKLWTQIQKQGMKSDVSWEKSAGLYADLYSRLASKGN